MKNPATAAEQVIINHLKQLEDDKAQNAMSRLDAQERIKRLDASEAKLNAAIKSMKAALKKLRRF